MLLEEVYLPRLQNPHGELFTIEYLQKIDRGTIHRVNGGERELTLPERSALDASYMLRIPID